MLQSRALGFWETFKAITHDACYGFETIGVTVQFVGEMDISLFTKALEFIYNRHPLLQATIYEKNYVYSYAFNGSFSDIPITFTQGVSEDILQRSFYEATNCSLDPTKYLWKVDVFYENEIVIFTITVHHAPCDGRSLTILLDDILYAYSCYLNQEKPNRPNLPLLPPTEHLTNTDITLESYLKQREDIIKLTTTLSLGPQQQMVPFDQRTTHVIHKELSKKQTESLLHFCAENNIKSNALLNGLMLIVAQHLNDKPLSLAMLTPVSPKSIDEEQVGCHVSLVTTLYENILAYSPVEMAQDYQAKLKEAILKQANLPKEFSTMDVCNAFGLNLDLDFYTYQLVVSNVGEMRVQKEYKGIVVDKILVGVNNRAGAVACVLATYVWDNKMQFAFVFTKPLISEKYMKDFTQTFMQQLPALCCG